MLFDDSVMLGRVRPLSSRPTAGDTAGPSPELATHVLGELHHWLERTRASRRSLPGSGWIPKDDWDYDHEEVIYADSPLCDGGWGSFFLQILALLQADQNCRENCPSNFGHLCEPTQAQSVWHPDTCHLEYECCHCRWSAPPPERPPDWDPFPPIDFPAPG